MELWNFFNGHLAVFKLDDSLCKLLDRSAERFFAQKLVLSHSICQISHFFINRVCVVRSNFDVALLLAEFQLEILCVALKYKTQFLTH